MTASHAVAAGAMLPTVHLEQETGDRGGGVGPTGPPSGGRGGCRPRKSRRRRSPQGEGSRGAFFRLRRARLQGSPLPGHPVVLRPWGATPPLNGQGRPGGVWPPSSARLRRGGGAARLEVLAGSRERLLPKFPPPDHCRE